MSIVIRRRLTRGVLACGAALALVGALAAPASAHSATHWTVRDLGTLNGDATATSVATAVNDRGLVVGWSDTGAGAPTVGTPSHAVLWRNGKILDLGTLGGYDSGATAVNNRGDVVGWSRLPDWTTHAFLWRSGRMIDLGTLGGPSSYARAINDRGDVVGSSRIAGTGEAVHAFLWHDGRMTDLGTYNGGYSDAFGISDTGVVVGMASIDGMNTVPVRFGQGRATPLTTQYHGSAIAVNDRGQIAGEYKGGGAVFLWNRGHLTDLPLLGGDTLPRIGGINDRGQVVGDAGGHAYLWQAGHITTLPPLRPIGSRALGINERGQVAGLSGTNMGGTNCHAVLWTQVTR